MGVVSKEIDDEELDKKILEYQAMKHGDKLKAVETHKLGGYVQNGYQGHGGYAHGGHGGTYTPCEHDGLDVIYTLPNLATIGGATKSKISPVDVSLIVDCTGSEWNPTPFIKKRPALPGFATLQSGWDDAPTLLLDWDDRKPPRLGLTFWMNLLGLIEPEWHVVFCCMGGHGRTGTAVSAMMVACGVGADDAIAQVRKRHCDKAVETQGQINYLYWLEDQVRVAGAFEGEVEGK